MALLPASEYILTFIKGKDYPEWMDEPSLLTMASGYLLPGEVPKEAMRRIAQTASRLLNTPSIEQPIFECLWNGWIAPSSPVWSNFGAARGLPISCFGSHVDDSIAGIFDTGAEIAMMSKLGGGTSAFVGDIRGRGSKIDNGTNKTNGSKPFLQIYDSIITHVSQGATRRGALAVYMPITHPDIKEFLLMRTVGDPVQQLLYGVTISDEFVDRLYNLDEEALKLWAEVLKIRGEGGAPYIFYEGNANNFAADVYQKLEKKITHSNLCTEIMLPDGLNESFVCCLLSLNLAKWDEWKNADFNGITVAGLSVWLLDAVLDEFIQKASHYKHLEKAVTFAENHRALGIGVLGWHTYLQQNDMPFCGMFGTSSTHVIFKQIRDQAVAESMKMAELFGAAPVCEEAGIARRHATLMAVAPTVSNATIQGWPNSPGIEPFASNYFVQKAAKGNFERRNPFLEQKLISYGMNNEETWVSIRDTGGSVQQLDFMSDDDKEVFLTFSEINQFELIKQAAARQKYIDQGQSLNVNIPPDTDPKQVSKLYLYAHKLGLKSLYYQRSQSILRGGLSVMDENECAACDG